MTNYRIQLPHSQREFKRLSAVLLGVLLILVLSLIRMRYTPIISASAQMSVICQSTAGLNRFGVNEPLGWPGLYPPERLERSLGMMADAGIGWVRLNFAWKDIQPRPDTLDYTHLDDVVRIAAEHHIQILGVLMAVPAWSSTAPESLKAERGSFSPVDKYRPQNMQDWLHYVQHVVERYDGDGKDDAPGSPRISHWEVWNEPNIALFWPPAPDVDEYLALLKATYQTIKATDNSAQVVLGGLANAGINTDGSNYLQALYDRGAAPYFDVVSIHIYTYPLRGISAVLDIVTALRTLMDTNGDQGKPLWLTEIGWSDAPNAWGAATVSQEDMAAFVTAVYTAPLPVDLIFWYNFRNIFPDSPDAEHNFGLVNADFTPKPAFKAYELLSSACAAK
jgi:hypothetical protein